MGEKVDIYSIFNKQIVITDYKIEASKFDRGTGKRLVLQIQIDGKDHIIFTGSSVLMDMIQQVNKNELPIRTTIVKDNKLFRFT